MTTRSVAVASIAVVFIVAGMSAGQTRKKPAAPAKVTAKAAAETSPKEKMPAAIKAVFEKAYPNAIVKNVTSEKEGGATVYEVESIDNGKTRDLIYRPDGTVVLIEDGIDEADLPAAVRQAVNTRHPKGRIVQPERVTRGSEVFYEMLVDSGGKRQAVAFNPDGKPHVDKPDKKEARKPADRKKD